MSSHVSSLSPSDFSDAFWPLLIKRQMIRGDTHIQFSGYSMAGLGLSRRERQRGRLQNNPQSLETHASWHGYFGPGSPRTMNIGRFLVFGYALKKEYFSFWFAHHVQAGREQWASLLTHTESPIVVKAISTARNKRRSTSSWAVHRKRSPNCTARCAAGSTESGLGKNR